MPKETIETTCDISIMPESKQLSTEYTSSTILFQNLLFSTTIAFGLRTHGR